MNRLSTTVKKIAETTLLQLDSQDIEDNSDPYDVIEKVVVGIPAAAVKVLREQIREERRQPIPAEIKRAVFERDHGHCILCRETQSLHYHHYQHVAHHGKNTTGNLVLLCANHHMAVHAERVEINKPRSVPVVATKTVQKKTAATGKEKNKKSARRPPASPSKKVGNESHG